MAQDSDVQTITLPNGIKVAQAQLATGPFIVSMVALGMIVMLLGVAVIAFARPTPPPSNLVQNNQKSARQAPLKNITPSFKENTFNDSKLPNGNGQQSFKQNSFDSYIDIDPKPTEPQRIASMRRDSYGREDLAEYELSEYGDERYEDDRYSNYDSKSREDDRYDQYPNARYEGSEQDYDDYQGPDKRYTEYQDDPTEKRYTEYQENGLDLERRDDIYAQYDNETGKQEQKFDPYARYETQSDNYNRYDDERYDDDRRYTRNSVGYDKEYKGRSEIFQSIYTTKYSSFRR